MRAKSKQAVPGFKILTADLSSTTQEHARHYHGSARLCTSMHGYALLSALLVTAGHGNGTAGTVMLINEESILIYGGDK